ncbi:MAG TPA: hypothetical protein VN029_11200, partial [Sphingomonas sp.]|nr:hypothetical protein [Sphingomonas sp.]
RPKEREWQDGERQMPIKRRNPQGFSPLAAGMLSPGGAAVKRRIGTARRHLQKSLRGGSVVRLFACKSGR